METFHNQSLPLVLPGRVFSAFWWRVLLTHLLPGPVLQERHPTDKKTTLWQIKPPRGQ